MPFLLNPYEGVGGIKDQARSGKDSAALSISTLTFVELEYGIEDGAKYGSQPYGIIEIPGLHHCLSI